LFSAGRSISTRADISLTPEVTGQSELFAGMNEKWNALADREARAVFGRGGI
jgi:hypothetical protein